MHDHFGTDPSCGWYANLVAVHFGRDSALRAVRAALSGAMDETQLAPFRPLDAGGASQRDAPTNAKTYHYLILA